MAFMKNPDPRARIDGNAIMVADDRQLKVVDSRILHLSGVRNCSLVKIWHEGVGRTIWHLNCHLHHVIGEYLHYIFG